MIRTVISLDEEDKHWLDRRAAREGISMTEVVRRALQRMRAEEESKNSFSRLLKTTHGLGSKQDGLAVQKRLRDEWRERERPA